LSFAVCHFSFNDDGAAFLNEKWKMENDKSGHFSFNHDACCFFK